MIQPAYQIPLAAHPKLPQKFHSFREPPRERKNNRPFVIKVCAVKLFVYLLVTINISEN